VKFTPSGGHITVRLTVAGSEAEIRVADTGRGFPPEFLPHLFERYVQENTATTRQGGIGLGLAIVKTLVERHGGTVHANSPGEGKGATFTVRLPVLAPHEVAEPDRGATADAATAAAPVRLDNLSILLVEDDADARGVLRLVLEIAGAKVEAVGSVREALRALDRFRPDVLISDIGIPDEDGYALIRHVRAREVDGRRIPTVALTGYVSAEDHARLLAAGFQIHLRKPVEPSTIEAAVASLVPIGKV
jgi:CheY-like chemotaxis protein